MSGGGYLQPDDDELLIVKPLFDGLALCLCGLPDLTRRKLVEIPSVPLNFFRGFMVQGGCQHCT